MCTVCGENLLPNTVMVYGPGASPTVLKSDSFTPLFQWNVFPSSCPRSAGKTRFPLESIVESEKRAFLSRMGFPRQPLENNWNATSISCPTWNESPSCGDTKQNESFSARGSSSAVTADKPGSFPLMVFGSGALSRANPPEGDSK